MRKKANVRLLSDRIEDYAEMTKAQAEELSQLRRVNKKAPAISALMHSWKHVKSSGPYSRDEMNER
ncbi:MAG: hypothetical protein WAM78_18835 [Candidatus Sulfotelmatobacter sp.]